MAFLFEKPLSGIEGFLYYENGAKQVLTRPQFLKKVGVLTIQNGGTGVTSVGDLKALLDVEVINDSLKDYLVPLTSLINSSYTNILASGLDISQKVTPGIFRFDNSDSAYYYFVKDGSKIYSKNKLYYLFIIPGTAETFSGSNRLNTIQILLREEGMFYRILIENRYDPITHSYSPIWTDFTPVATTSPTLEQVLTAGNTTTKQLFVTDKTPATNRWSGSIQTLGGIGAEGNIYGDKVYGAVYNDYAEYRISDVYFEPGTVIVEDPDRPDYVTLPTENNRLAPMVVSDTYGFCIGPKDCLYPTPVATSGRSLVKLHSSIDRDTLKPGLMLKAECDGTASILSNEEYISNPSLLLGFVSSIPDYEVWENIKVNNRIWIRGVH